MTRRQRFLQTLTLKRSCIMTEIAGVRQIYTERLFFDRLRHKAVGLGLSVLRNKPKRLQNAPL